MEITNQARSTAGIRQFENTAIAKLEAEGVPSYIARAFVHQGIPKSGSQDMLKNTVCKMTYEKFFVERSAADFKDPFRVGALVPTVTETNNQKFFTEFAMSDLDAAKFMKAFPEFDVIARGRTYNQHAFYANKRYAETELLVSMIYKHAHAHGLDPRSVVDLGGNHTWHSKRDRSYVHCDNPVLSARDIMRYTTREIFSQAGGEQTCRNTFQTCDHRAAYAMGVHSTYDLTPKQLAYAMMQRRMSAFFGVINYIPGIETRDAGSYEADGIVANLVRPTRQPHYVEFTFKHDPSLHYTHKLSVLRKYLLVKHVYQFVDPSNKPHVYTYKIESVRGNSLMFSVQEGVPSGQSSTAVWTPPSKSMYYISLQFIGLDKMEVSAEFFDRLVLQAASSRNIQEYDILALYRYAKSLRQRVSINGVVLSSGYTQNPEQLVYCTIAAFSVAAAYKQETISYFKQATSQVVSLRGRGFLRDTLHVIGTALLKIFAALPAALAHYTGLVTLNDRLKQLIAVGGSVQVELYKPHANQGLTYHKHYTSIDGPLNFSLSTSKLIRTGHPVRGLPMQTVALKGPVMPEAPPGYAYKPSTASLRPLFAECAGKMYCFRSRATVSYDSIELPRPITQFIHYDLSDVDLDQSHDLEETRNRYYAHLTTKIAGFARKQPRYQVMPNGDRLYTLDSDATVGHFSTGSDYVPFNLDGRKYIVLRGVGKSAVVLTPPTLYSKGTCLRFVLLYDHCLEYNEILDHSKARGVDEIYYELPDPPAQQPSPDLSTDGTWEDLTPQFGHPTFNTFQENSDYVVRLAERGEYVMSGGLSGDTPTPPATASAPSTPRFVAADSQGPMTVSMAALSPTVNIFDDDPSIDPLSEARRQLRASPPPEGAVADASDTVVSDEIVPGAHALEEQIYVCSRSEQIAIETSSTVVDLVLSAAGGHTPASRLRAVLAGHPGDMKGVVVSEGTEEWLDLDGQPVTNMAVSDGEKVYDKITDPPPPGVYVTSRVMEVYTGAAIKRALQSVLTDSFTCPVVCVNGVAGSGKSYQIERQAKPGDVVLCETSRSLEDIASELLKIPGWRGHNYTVDAYLMHLPVRECDVLWIDEAFRLHAAKIFAVMKLMRPRIVYAFGDDKQIPTLPFIPGYDFVYHEFPFLSIERRTLSYRIPADIAMALSSAQYYGLHVTTMNPVLHSVQGPEQYLEGMFDFKPLHVPLLVYTQNNKEDLVKRGVKNVMTIGESQGKTFDDVVVFREDKLNKELYYSHFQTLVAVTRHRRSFRYVTVDTITNDNSLVAKLLRSIGEAESDIVLASHHAPGVRSAYDSRALASRRADSDAASHVRSASLSRTDSVSLQDDLGDLADYVADFDGL